MRMRDKNRDKRRKRCKYIHKLRTIRKPDRKQLEKVEAREPSQHMTHIQQGKISFVRVLLSQLDVRVIGLDGESLVKTARMLAMKTKLPWQLREIIHKREIIVISMH